MHYICTVWGSLLTCRRVFGQVFEHTLVWVVTSSPSPLRPLFDHIPTPLPAFLPSVADDALLAATAGAGQSPMDPPHATSGGEAVPAASGAEQSALDSQQLQAIWKALTMVGRVSYRATLLCKRNYR